jgi:hypothetical protein
VTTASHSHDPNESYWRAKNYSYASGMTTDLPPDTEKYRQQLEARARIYFSTSDIWLRVCPRASNVDWVADLHYRKGGDPTDTTIEPYADHPGGHGSSAERALEDFAEQLDARERARESALA